MGNLLRFCLSMLNYKRVSEIKTEPFLINVDKNNIVCFHLSSNPIIAVQREGQTLYFRECPVRGKKIDFIKKSIKRFFCYIHNTSFEKINFKQKPLIRLSFTEDEVEAFQRYVYERIGDKKFIRSLRRIDKGLARLRFSVWGEKNALRIEEADGLGLHALPEGLLDVAVYFVWYMRSVALTLKNQNVVFSKKYSLYNATKSISTCLIAETLGLKRLVTSARWCWLDIEGDRFFGLISPAAPGERGNDLSNVKATSFLQRELMALHVLDAICFQPDHGPNNYNVAFDGEEPIRICAFDNDNPNTFLPLSTIKKGLSGCDSFIDSKGRINRGNFDIELARRILNLDLKETDRRVKPYLNVLQRKALVARIKKIRNAIRKTQYHKKDFLIDSTGWDETTLNEELSGKYGKTYLTSLLKSSF